VAQRSRRRNASAASASTAADHATAHGQIAVTGERRVRVGAEKLRDAVVVGAGLGSLAGELVLERVAYELQPDGSRTTYL
jgi:hypothetical protein